MLPEMFLCVTFFNTCVNIKLLLNIISPTGALKEYSER